jgi:hypothetical protein
MLRLISIAVAVLGMMLADPVDAQAQTRSCWPVGQQTHCSDGTA